MHFTQQYRDADLRVLQTKLAQLDTILPMQSKVIQLPFENSASGFDLFSEGATALVPELTGFSGADSDCGAGTGGHGLVPMSLSTTAVTNSPTTPNVKLPASATGVTVTTSLSEHVFDSDNLRQLRGAGSLGDIFVFGKYINLLDSKVIVCWQVRGIRDP